MRTTLHTQLLLESKKAQVPSPQRQHLSGDYTSRLATAFFHGTGEHLEDHRAYMPVGWTNLRPVLRPPPPSHPRLRGAYLLVCFVALSRPRRFVSSRLARCLDNDGYILGIHHLWDGLDSYRDFALCIPSGLVRWNAVPNPRHDRRSKQRILKATSGITSSAVLQQGHPPRLPSRSQPASMNALR